MVGSTNTVVVSSVQAVKPHSRLAGFALVGVPGLDAVLTSVYTTNGCDCKVGVA